MAIPEQLNTELVVTPDAGAISVAEVNTGAVFSTVAEAVVNTETSESATSNVH